MYERLTLDEKIRQLKENAMNDKFVSEINENKVIKAKALIKTNAYTSIDLFVLMASLNLLNAAIKHPKYKYQIDYADIKGNVSRILHYLISLKFNKYDLTLSINPTTKCVYIEIFNFQFSFHNIIFSEKIRAYIASGNNKIVAWNEIRLQKIAGEIFDLALSLIK